MLIRLDVFAEMLNIWPGQLQYAARTIGELDGLSLPECQWVPGEMMMMFDRAEATTFTALWHTRSSVRSPDSPPALLAPGVGPIPMKEFAKLCGLPPLALFQAIKGGNTLRGVPLPEPLGAGSELLFDPDNVMAFLQHYHCRLQE